MVRMEYIGSNEGFIPFRNPFGGSGETYRGGVGVNRYADVAPEDVQFLVDTGAWRKVPAGDKTETPRKGIEAVVSPVPAVQAEIGQQAADALVASGDVELPKRKAAGTKA